MKPLRQIVYSIKEFISGFNIMDDNLLDDILIAHKVDDVRSTLIGQEYLAGHRLNDLYYQNITLAIEPFDTAKKDVFNVMFPEHERVVFPEVLTGIHWANIKYLGSLDFKFPFNRVSLDGFTYSDYRRWSSAMPNYFVLGHDTAILRGDFKGQYLLMVAIFKSPTELPQRSWDDIYPAPNPFKLEMIVKQDIAAGLGIRPDEINDARQTTGTVEQQKRTR